VKQRACAVFRSERHKYALCFTCERCTYFDERAERCSHGYPNQAHRASHFAEDREVELVFCKDFELL
jgi:hypothetical protein